MQKAKPIDEEFLFDGSAIISQTDLDGKILYANRLFCETSGFTKEELLNQPHNIVRHPDMPRSVFIKLWETIQGGQVWNGLIKNLRKDGKYYWVDSEILPIFEDDQVAGYIAVRRAASRKDIQENETLYKKMKESEA